MRLFKGELWIEVVYDSEAVVYDQKDEWGRMLHLDIDVKASRSKTPNQGVVAIYNLKESDRNRIRRDGKSIRVFCKYHDMDEPVMVFTGDIVFAYTIKDGTDWKTEIKAGDGWRSFSQSITSRNYAAGTSNRDIVKQVAADMGLALKESGNVLRGLIDGSITLDGLSKDTLDEVVFDAGGEWSIQDNEIHVTPIKEPIDGEAIVLDSTSGLLENPSISEKCLKFRSQMIPALRPGKVVELLAKEWVIESGSGRQEGNKKEQKKKKKADPKKPKQQEEVMKIDRITDYDGFYICQSVQHVGNNYGGPFDSICEALPYNQPELMEKKQ